MEPVVLLALTFESFSTLGKTKVYLLLTRWLFSVHLLKFKWKLWEILPEKYGGQHDSHTGRHGVFTELLAAEKNRQWCWPGRYQFSLPLKMSLGMSLLHTLDIFQVWYIIFTTWRCMIPRLFTQCIALQWDHVGRSGHVICPVKAYDERTKTGEHRWPHTWFVHPTGVSICSYMKLTLIHLLVFIGTVCDWSNDNETYV